jgi:hypothetical protein
MPVTSPVVTADTSRSGTVVSGETLGVDGSNNSLADPLVGMEYDVEALLGSDSLSDSWFTMQDFQLDDWTFNPEAT